MFGTGDRHTVPPQIDYLWGRRECEGLYGVEFRTAVNGTGNGVLRHSGKLRSSNSDFAFTGEFQPPRAGTSTSVSTLRQNPDPGFKPLFGTDMITLTLKGTENGDMVDFEGSALQLPGVTFKAVLTWIGD